jgi:transposase
MMEVFGEEYDLSNCTPEEVAEVEAWMEAHKGREAEIPRCNTPSELSLEHGHGDRLDAPSNDLDIAVAIANLERHTQIFSRMRGDSRQLELFELVHPLGAGLSIDDAAAMVGISRPTAYRWLKTLADNNPDWYDLHKWPTRHQLEVYRLIHPDLGGLTYREAAKATGSTYQHVKDMMCRMRKTHPQAFSFERIPRPTVVRFTPNLHDEEVKEKF